MAGIIIVLVALAYGIVMIVYQEMPPELLMNLSPIEYSAGFLRVRHRVFHENAPLIIVLIALWSASIIDIALMKKISDPET